MRFFDYDSHLMLSLIRRDMEDAQRWEIIPYWGTNNHKKYVKLQWTPCKLVYNFLYYINNQIITSGIQDHLFSLHKPRSWRQKTTTQFDNNTARIIIDWHPQNNHQLTHSDVNLTIDGLTAQRILLTLRIPYFTGLCHTGGSYDWHHKKWKDFWRSKYPYYQTCCLDCYVSSDRGIYARADGDSEEERVIIPLKCTYSQSHFYNNNQRGYNVFMLNNRRWFIKGPKWEDMFKYNSFAGQFTRAGEYIKKKSTDEFIFDETSNERVKLTDYIKGGWHYRYHPEG